MTSSVLSEGLGNLSLGVFLGYMAWYFLSRNASKSIDGLASVAGVIFGAATLQVLSADAGLHWLYPVGLVIGWILWIVVRKVGGEPYGIAMTREAPPRQ